MRKRCLLFFVLICLSVCFACVFAACDLFSGKSNENQVCNHNYGAWTTTQPATCTEKGSRQKVCSLCGDIVAEDIDALGHVEVIDRAVSPTCTETGLTEGKHCGRCEAVLVAQQMVNVLGHNYVDGECSRCHSIDPNYHPIDPEEEARLERVALENDIETSLKQKLNTKFEEELVESIDVKYFSFEQDSRTLKTTFYINGTVKFVDDDIAHTFSLGKILTSEEFNNLSFLYYVDIDETKDLSVNYSVDDLTVAKTSVLAWNIDEITAQLDGRTWDLNMLTPTQLEKQLEEDFEAKANDFWTGKYGDAYFKNIDFKYFSTEYDYGYILKLNGETGNIYNDTIKNLCIKISISHADYDYLNEYVLTTPVNEANDLKDNYNSQQLNQVIDIINNDVSYIFAYKIDRQSYTAKYKSEGAYYYSNMNTQYFILIKAESNDCEINENCKYIGESAFEGRSGITSITIPDGIISIGNNAFAGCTNLQYNVYNNAKYLGSYTNPYFALIEANNKYITSCEINENCKIVAGGAFSGCTGLTSITIPDSVTSIGDYAFYDCRGLTSIAIPDSVTSIGDYAFYECTGLTSITIPDSVTSIGDYAFYDCRGLTSIAIPDSVTSIGDYAFSGCSGLKSIVVEVGNTKYHSVGNCLIKTDNKILVAGCKNSVIPTDGSVTSIGNRAFYNCRGLTSVTIPNSVTSIGDYAFYDCRGLTSIAIPDSVTSIGDYAFGGCWDLTSITIPSSVASIGEYAFSGCVNLQYNIYGNAKYLGDTTNPYVLLIEVINSDITSCTINENCKFVERGAFSNCSGLTSITIPDSVTSIGRYAFYGCTGLTSITIGNSVTSIGGSAFYSTGLTSINYTGDIANWCAINGRGSLMSYGAKLYIDGNEITGELVIPNSVTIIGDSAFQGCTSLTSITIPDSVTSIGSSAFYNCRGLMSINYNGTKSQWNAISKDYHWGYNTGNYTIHCTDGDIAKS